MYFFDNHIVLANNGQRLIEYANSVKNGSMLIHVTTGHNVEDLAFGIDPSIGPFLKTTEAIQWAMENYGRAVDLTFFSDQADWAEFLPKERGGDLQIVLVEKSPTIVKYLGDDKVQTDTGNVISWEMHELSDYEDELLKSIPPGVETGDWFTTKTQDVVDVLQGFEAREFVELMKL